MINSVNSNPNIYAAIAKDAAIPAVRTKNGQDVVALSNSEREVNSYKNVFLKQYIEKRAQKSGIIVPENTQIFVSSPKEFSKEEKNLLHHVRTKIYHARVTDMFNLLEQDKQKVEERVGQMKISDKDKEKILSLKEIFDNYYKIEIAHNGKRINILNPTDEEKAQLQTVSPEFAKFVEKEQPNLKKVTTDFTREEIKASELSEAGNSSRYAAAPLLAFLLFNVGKGGWESKGIKEEMSKDLAGFLAKQKEIYKEGLPKFVNPLKAFKNAKQAALIGLILTTLSGGLDDLLGGVKDAFQDCNNFGTKTGLAFAIPSALMGLATSAIIAPTVNAHIDYKRAEKVLVENGIVKKAAGSAKWLQRAKLGGIAAVLGVLIAATSSGSSWTSMGLTRWWMGKKGDDLVKKNIIDAKDNTSKNTNKNMMAYEAYEGKWSGIAKGDPTIGAIGGGLGLFTHTNPYVQSLSFGLQGCSETVTACLYQLAGNKVRNDKLASQKAQLLRNEN